MVGKQLASQESVVYLLSLRLKNVADLITVKSTKLKARYNAIIWADTKFNKKHRNVKNYVTS